MNRLEEQWRPLPSDDKYLVSTWGNVLIKNYKCHKGEGRTVPAAIRLIEGTGTTWDGYQSTMIRGKCKLIHQLVGETFIPNPIGYRQINHKDGDKANNYFENLEWSSQSYNCIHSYTIGTNPVEKKRGVLNGRAKLDDLQVRVIKTLYPKISQVKLGRYFNVSQGMISAIVRGANWTHV